MARCTVLIPTHDHFLTLPLSLLSVLWQEEQDFEVIIIGDGVTDRVREVAASFSLADHRIRFLDFPKGPHHGEIYRHQAILGANSQNIFYLCDDDLLLPAHLRNLVSLLEYREFVQSRNGYIDRFGQIRFYGTVLSRAEDIDWHLQRPRRNAVSLTGTAHDRQTYLSLPIGWETTPEGEWPDHFMWKKFFRIDGLRAATHPEMTTIQLPTSDGREAMSQEARYQELLKWYERFLDPSEIVRFYEEVQEAGHYWLTFYQRAYIDCQIAHRPGRRRRRFAAPR